MKMAMMDVEMERQMHGRRRGANASNAFPAAMIFRCELAEVDNLIYLF